MVSRRIFNAICLTAAGVFATRSAAHASEPQKGPFPVNKTPEEWKKILTKEQYYVLREHGTERAFTSPLDKNYAAGRYDCAGCGAPLFVSDTKFDSRTGWPSFWKPIDKAVGTKSDRTFFMVRTEVHCATCGGHLGHVFDDGPAPTGQRYCMNGVALKFVPQSDSRVPPGKS
jgi:peptide-methionine (R)-S-oxide reductase